MGKAIIELIGNLVEITGKSELDGVFVIIIVCISFAVAFNLVGKINLG